MYSDMEESESEDDNTPESLEPKIYNLKTLRHIIKTTIADHKLK